MFPELRAFPEQIRAQRHIPELQRLLLENGEYLWSAYEQIEKYWYNEFSQFDTIRVVLLSEAPRWGENKSYFYNPNRGATEFFGYANYAEAFGTWGPRLVVSKNATVVEKKAELLAAMRQVGVLVLDVFPFPLNDDTVFSYTSLGSDAYGKLFGVTAPLYFRKKLRKVVKRMVPGGKLVFRYKRVQDAAELLVKQELIESGISGSRLFKRHVGLPLGRLNQELLQQAYTTTSK